MTTVAFWVGIGFHGSVLAYLLRELCWEYAYRQWRVAWGYLFVAELLITLRRVGLFLAPEFLATPFFVTLTEWIPMFHSLGLLLGLWHLTHLLHTDLPLHMAPLGNIVINETSVIVGWGEQATAIFGWTPAEAIGQTLMQTIMPSSAWEGHRAGIARFLATNGDGVPLTRVFAFLARHKSGGDIPIEITVAAFHTTPGGWYFHGTVRRLIAI